MNGYFILLSLIIITSVVLGGMLETRFGFVSSYFIKRGTQIVQDKDDYSNAMEPKQEYWNKIPLQHNKLIVQILGKDIKIKDVRLSGDVGYTGSMRPTIYGGVRLLERPYNLTGERQEGNCKYINEGDIISFRVAGYEYEWVHRVTDNNIGKGYLFTQGDMNSANDFVDCHDITRKIVGVLYT